MWVRITRRTPSCAPSGRRMPVQFMVVQNPDETVSLLSRVNNRYVSVDLDQGGTLVAARAASSIGKNLSWCGWLTAR